MKTISFSGYEWFVRDTGNLSAGPGPNKFAGANVEVDHDGRLHLKISNNLDGWHCAELNTQESLGFGRYQFQLSGRIDQLDRNVVLGLFKYPTPAVGPDGTNEIDIEFAQWGGSVAPNNADYVVFPASGPRVPQDHIEFSLALSGSYTTHRFLWKTDQVKFQSLGGHRDDDTNEIQSWLYRPHQARLMPQEPTQVRINLWLFHGMPPSDEEEVELIVNEFTFVPLSELPSHGA